MSLWYFLSLWGRNIIGIFNKTFDLEISFFLVLLPIHILTVGLSIIFASLAKTIFDCLTRTFIDGKDNLSSIGNMNPKQMKALLKDIREPSIDYKSNSSKNLVTQLSTDDELIAEKDNNEKIKLAIVEEFSKKRAWVIYKNPNDFGAMIRFRELSNNNLNDKKDRIKQELDKGGLIYTFGCNGTLWENGNVQGKGVHLTKKLGFEESRKHLLNYMQDEKNNGKKLFNRINDFWSKPSTEEDSTKNESRSTALTGDSSRLFASY